MTNKELNLEVMAKNIVLEQYNKEFKEILDDWLDMKQSDSELLKRMYNLRDRIITTKFYGKYSDINSFVNYINKYIARITIGC